MSQEKSADKNVSEKVRSKISVPEKALLSEQSSASKSRSTLKKSVASKHFIWDHEKSRPTAEYLDKRFHRPFNTVAPELRVIGGLGPIKCLQKNKHQPLINRPTLVQKVCHTRTKLLPNFTLTEKIDPVVCQKKKKLDVEGAARRVKFVENLPTPSLTPVSSETKETFNHQNPFNLDLNALSVYQKQKHNTDEMEKRRNYQIIRRTMETKALLDEQPDKVEQEIRDKKFGVPELFNVIEDDEIVIPVEISPECKVVSAIDKPKNREVVDRHFQNKAEKIRRHFMMIVEENEKLAKEKEIIEKEERENFVFHLADESLAASECDANENVASKEFPPAYEKFDYPINESELLEFKRQLNEKSLDLIKRDKLFATMTMNNANDESKEIGIPCGQKIGSRTMLRNFHDRLCSEPRGESNYYHLKGEDKPATCFTHNEWLDSLVNDPEILKKPPRGKLVSTVKVAQEPNDDRMLLFDETSSFRVKKKKALVSPIRQHIQQIDEKIKIRMSQSSATKAKSHMCIVNNDKNKSNPKRYQRMQFMGIPVKQTTFADSPMKKISHDDLQAIVAKFSQTSLLLSSQELRSNDKSTPKHKHSTVKNSLGAVNLIPKVPQFDCEMEEKRERSKVKEFSPFKKAQPRGTNAKNLRVDKSLPWIEDELNATKAKRQKALEHRKTFSDEALAEKATVRSKKKVEVDVDQSALKETYSKIISTKFQDYNPLQSKLSEAEESDEEIQSVESSSSFSSTGTNFTNDSGSVLILGDRRIPKSELNADKKFLNRSLVTTAFSQNDQNPYFLPRVEHFDRIKTMLQPPDRFHTHRTRSRADVRERIHIESLSYDKELIGTEAFRMASKMATDIDEYYQSEFYQERSHMTFAFKPKSEIMQLRETFLRKLDVYWMREQIIKGEIETMRQEAVMNAIKVKVEEYDRYLEESQEVVYRNSNRTMQETKKYYAVTDELKKQRDYQLALIEPLKMSIFYLGTDFVRGTMIQNFQLLLKPTEWRKSFDYIHLQPDGELEGYRQSIAERETKCLWNRDNVTVFVIKDFIEKVYLAQNHRPEPIFENGKAFLEAFRELQATSCRALLQFQSIAQILADTEKEFMTLTENNTAYINKLTTMMNNLGRRGVFMEKRRKEVKAIALSVTGKPMEESVSTEELRNAQALIDTTYQKFLASKTGDGSSSKNISYYEKISLLEARVFGTFEKLDNLPHLLLAETEEEVRRERNIVLKEAFKASRTEHEMNQRIDQFLRCLAKPPKKEKREGKLPMSVLPKKPKKERARKALLTELEVEYAHAFTEIGGIAEDIKFDTNAKTMIDRIQNESTPFYVDHLLSKLNVKISKDGFKSLDEILNDEEKNMKYKDVMTTVRSKLKTWHSLRELIKKENIRKTPYLYEL